MTGNKIDALAIAQEAWGMHLPEFIRALAQRCNEIGQRRVAQAIKYSASVVNQVLRNKYQGDMKKIESAIRGGLLAIKVKCPGVHHAEIPLHDCLSYQKMKLSTASPMRSRIHSACRNGCPNSKIGR